MPLVPVNPAPSDVKDSQEGLTNELDGAGEDGADEQEEAEQEETVKTEESDEADVEHDEAAKKDAEDAETLKKRLQDTQAALTKARQELKKRQPEREQSQAGSLTEEQALKIYERSRSDEKFLDLNPDLARQAEALRKLRAADAPNATLEEVALRYGFVEKAKLDAAKARGVRGSVDRKQNGEEIPNPLSNREAYKKWREKNITRIGLKSVSVR